MLGKDFFSFGFPIMKFWPTLLLKKQNPMSHTLNEIRNVAARLTNTNSKCTLLDRVYSSNKCKSHYIYNPIRSSFNKSRPPGTLCIHFLFYCSFDIRKSFYYPFMISGSRIDIAFGPFHMMRPFFLSLSRSRSACPFTTALWQSPFARTNEEILSNQTAHNRMKIF